MPKLVPGAGSLQDGPDDSCLLVVTDWCSRLHPHVPGLVCDQLNITGRSDGISLPRLQLVVKTQILSLSLGSLAVMRSPHGEEVRPPASSHVNELRVDPSPQSGFPITQSQPTYNL